MTEAAAELAVAIAAYQQGERGEALRISRSILAREPDNAGAHYVLGIANADAGELAEALSALERAVALMPEKANFHITLGNLYLSLERDAAAARAEAAGSGPRAVNPGYASAVARLSRNSSFVLVRDSRSSNRSVGSVWLAPEELNIDIIRRSNHTF